MEEEGFITNSKKVIESSGSGRSAEKETMTRGKYIFGKLQSRSTEDNKAESHSNDTWRQLWVP